MQNYAKSLSTLCLTLLGGIAAAWPGTASAQQVGDSVITAALGLPADAETGAEPLVYLTWWPTGQASWQPETHAIYSKPGAPDDPGSFSLAAVVRPQTDPIGVGQSILQAERLGDDRIDLSNNIDGLYDKIIPVAGMGLNEKLAAIVDVARFDAESAETLALLTRRHPAAALAAGVAFVDPIADGQVRTYEIRRCPGDFTDASDCTVVSGRVVVRGGEFKRLPPPSQPVEVPFVDNNGQQDPRGNLNVPLRWGTPPELRERSFFQFGFNVYRVAPEIAEDAGWDTDQPAPEEFFSLMEAKPAAIERVNERPILPDQSFSPGNAGDLDADPKSYFVIDDNDRYDPGGQPFQDGDNFYYFVAALDLLGRPGAVSFGTPVTICFRIPPQAPMDLKVRNDYSYDATSETQTQVFELDWDPAQTREYGPDIAEYWIYRWDSIEQMHSQQAFPFTSINPGSLTGGRIATVPASTTEYVDNVGDSPSISYSQEGDLGVPAVVNDAAANRTFWYTVRAVDASSCGGNVSGNSGPAYGVLRDRVGPGAPSGSVIGSCVEPIVSLSDDGSIDPGNEAFDSDLTYLKIDIQRLDSRITWAEVFVGPLGDERSYLGRFDFPETNILTLTKKLPNQLLQNSEVNQGTIFVRVGTAIGARSNLAEATFQTALNPDKQTGNFVQSFDFLATVDEEIDCTVHEPLSPGADPTGSITPIDLELNLVPTTREWKLYRRVDDGPLTLIEQGIANFVDTPTVSTQDRDLPLNGGRVCYFLQVFDLQGNPSVFRRIDCMTVRPRTELPTPMLSPVQPVGESPDTGGARIKWFSPPAGVERFELAIRSGSGTPDPEISDALRLDLPPGSSADLSITRIEDEDYRSYITGRVGANFDAGPAYQLLWDQNFESGNEYFIRVRAVGAGDSTGSWSNEATFLWSSAIDFSQPFDPSDCVVPWPVRGTVQPDGTFPVALPTEGYEVGLEAAVNPKNPDGSVAYNGGAVRVGFVDLENLDINLSSNWDSPPKGYANEGIFPLPRGAKEEASDLIGAFYARANGQPLPAFMLYRYQVPNALWSTVSGDVYQVSPLIDRIASAPATFQTQPIHAVHDPYVFLIPEPKVDNGYHLYVKDTQPVIQGASYRYLIVRFDQHGEIAQIIPLDPVTVN